MNPTLEPILYVTALTLCVVFFRFFPKQKPPFFHPLFVIFIILAQLLLFTSPFVQKQMADFGLTQTSIAPLSLGVSLITLTIIMFVPIPQWVVTISIIPLTFYVGQMAYYDATHIIGPVHDLVMGKPPLSSPSWYGFLPIIGLSFVFRIIPLTLVNLYVGIAVIETAGYLLLYRFSLSFFKDIRWANVTIFLIILFHFLVQVVDRNYYLQSTFFRFGIWVPLAFAMISKKQWAIIASLLLALFWTTDMGLYITGAYMTTLFILKKPMWQTLKFMLPAVIFLAFFKNYWAFSISYGSIPMFATPIPLSPFPWLYLATPVLTLLFVREPIIVFLSLLSLFLFTYFTGHSHLNSLRTINIPLIILFVYWMRKIPKVAGILTLILPVALWGSQALTNLTTGNIVTTMQTMQHPYNPITPILLPDRYRNNIAIISPWDTYYLLEWRMTNPLGSNCLLCYWTPEMAKPLIESAKTLDVHYILVDKDRVGYEGRVSWIFDPISSRYRFVESIGKLDVYEKI